MTTLSLFDEPDALDPELPRDRAALDPDALRELRELLPAIRPVRAGGLTLPVLAFATLVASPAIWQCLVRHAMPVHVMLERYVVIAIGCLLVSEVARRLLRQATPDRTAGEPVEEAPDAPAVADTPVMPAAVTVDPPGAGPTDPALALLAAEG